jgi:hypothetical protein
MPRALTCYYLDAPLAENDLEFVERTLLGPWARFKTGAASLVQKRVPAVLPLPKEDGTFEEDPEQRARRVRSHLRHAGIQADNGRQVVWVMPRDPAWDAVFQFAIRLETGFAPFVAQRWFMENGDLVRGEIRLVDTQMLVQGL